MQKSTLRKINDHLAQATMLARQMGDESLARSLERKWGEVAGRCEQVEAGGQQQAAA